MNHLCKQYYLWQSLRSSLLLLLHCLQFHFSAHFSLSLFLSWLLLLTLTLGCSLAYLLSSPSRSSTSSSSVCSSSTAVCLLWISFVNLGSLAHKMFAWGVVSRSATSVWFYTCCKLVEDHLGTPNSVLCLKGASGILMICLHVDYVKGSRLSRT